MKKCAKCNKEKDESEFIKNSCKKGGLSSYCKECKRIIDKEYYADSSIRRKKVKDRRERNYKEVVTYIELYLREHPCVDCGSRDIRVLDFDHVNGNKDYNVSSMGSCSIETVMSEIRKCEVRCANCHRIRHYNERMKSRL